MGGWVLPPPSVDAQRGGGRLATAQRQLWGGRRAGFSGGAGGNGGVGGANAAAAGWRPHSGNFGVDGEPASAAAPVATAA